MIVWPVDKDCGISFREVFAADIFADIEIKVIEIDLKYLNYDKYGGFWSNIKRIHLIGAVRFLTALFKSRLCEKLSQMVFRENYFSYFPAKNVEELSDKYYEHMSNTWNNIRKRLMGDREIYIHAFCGIVKDKGQENIDYGVIKFRKEYLERAEKIIIPGEKVIGIHIRRTDHQRAAKVSNTNAFIKKIDEIIEGQKEARFFLATDDISEEKKLKNIYGNRLKVQQDKEWGREESGEMKSGIVDCLCLSRCEYILGSYTSVFSFFAARYGKKRLLICKEESERV